MRAPIYLFILSFCLSANAQLSNGTFRIRSEAPATKYGISLEALQYLKNNEYFNNINPGETLFGFQAKALLHYRIGTNATITAGTLLQKDFGDVKFFSKAFPILNFEVRKKMWDFQLGSIKPNIHHNLIEPLLDYENIIRQPVEYGFQARRASCGNFYDVWLNWRQKANGPEGLQEQIIFGQSLDYFWFHAGSFTLYNPVQAVVYHQGGQGLNLSSHIRTTVNAATGLRLVYGDSSHPIALQSMVLASLDNSPTLSQPYKNGWASFTSLMFKIKYHEVSLSWWYGREFTAATGNPVFGNVNLNDVYANTNTRRLAMLRYVYSRPIVGDKLWIDFRLEPYFDFEKKALEFSQGLFFRYVNTLNIKMPRWSGF